jgi:outer membrane protein OmpA-like peptidoglycan-associated protein
VLTNKHKHLKDSSETLAKIEHNDVLHNRTAQQHHKVGMHSNIENKDTTTAVANNAQHKDFLHSKSAQKHHKNQEATSENSILDGSGISSTPSDENSILDGKPLNSMVIKGVDMNVQPLEVGMTYTINNILFASGSYVLSENTKTIINEFSKFLNENQSIQISIQGHTDDQGDANKNITLSQNRANAVKEYLISLGINADRLEAIGYGAAKPKVPNDSEENRKMNRRTEFQILKL